MDIPSNDINTNIWSKKTYLNININNFKIDNELTSQHTLMGDFSTSIRNEILNIGYNADSINNLKELLDIDKNQNIDTFYTENLVKIYPYNFSYKYKGNVTDLVQKLDGVNYVIRLDKIINHYLLNTKEQKRILNYYCPFTYSDINKIYLKFNKEIELIDNSTIGNISISTSTANYDVKLNKIDKNVLMIESKLDVLKIKANPTKYDELHKVNQAVLKASQSRILIKTL